MIAKNAPMLTRARDGRQEGQPHAMGLVGTRNESKLAAHYALPRGLITHITAARGQRRNRGAQINKLSHFKVTLPPAFFAITLLLSGGSSLSAQSTISSSESVVCQLCPLIEVTCPSNALSTMPFNVAVRGLPPEKKITYTWEVHNATIARGQGTASIIVETQPNKVVTVTIEIGGLDRSCVASDSCSMSWEPPQPRQLDHYGQASASEEKQRLANLAAEIDNNPTAMAYIIVYGRDLKRGERAKKHLTEKHGIQPARLVILRGGHNEAPLIELYLVPSGAEPPTPANRKSASP